MATGVAETLLQNSCPLMQLEVFAAVNVRIAVFWVVTPCSLIGGYKNFGGAYCFLLQGRYVTGHFLAVTRWRFM
jgi:hypothetical protein